MGIQSDIIAAPSGSDLVFLELFKQEVRRDIQVLKDKIEILERKLEDPFG